jgi:hypothetical protein
LESYFPHTLPSPIRNSTNKEIGRLNPLQKSIYAWLTRQTFTPQQFHIHPKLERQKEWTWAIIAGQPLQVVLRRIRQYSLWFFGTLTLFLKKILGST